jgi:hypothetical protein
MSGFSAGMLHPDNAGLEDGVGEKPRTTLVGLEEPTSYAVPRQEVGGIAAIGGGRPAGSVRRLPAPPVGRRVARLGCTATASDDEVFEITTARMLVELCNDLLVALDDHRAHVAPRLKSLQHPTKPVAVLNTIILRDGYVASARCHHSGGLKLPQRAGAATVACPVCGGSGKGEQSGTVCGGCDRKGKPKGLSRLLSMRPKARRSLLRIAGLDPPRCYPLVPETSGDQASGVSSHSQSRARVAAT